MNLRKLAMLAGLYLPLQAFACEFPAGTVYRVALDPGHLVVGRDVPVGTVFYQSSTMFQVETFTPQFIFCREETAIEVTSPLAQEQGSPWVRPGEVLLHTPIPGVGLVVDASMGPSRASEHWQFIPGLGYLGWGVPHREIVKPVVWGTIIREPFLSAVRYRYRLIKTGPIDPGMGPQPLAGLMLAEFTSNRSGRVLELAFSSGTLNVAQCGLPGAASQQIRVPMGTWQVAQFNGQGSHTEAKPFAIPLSNCTGGSVPGNFPSAYLRLDPRNGSPILDAQRGIVGLNADSDASGVGVQVLRHDNTPMPLAEELPVFQLADGDYELPLSARYIQLGSRPPGAGVANASLSFTLTYK